MLKILRRMKPVAEVVDDTAARLILTSPLSDPATIVAVFGSLDAPLADVNARYFDVEAHRRPRLSVHFDPDWYAERNPDVVEARMDPYLHFLMSGMAEGRAPHPLVDLDYVREQLAADADAVWDVATLADVLRTGRARPHPLFDPGYYLATNEDVRAAGIPALAHFLQSGAAEGRRPNPLFDADWYIARHPGVPTDRYEAFVEFASRGDAEGRSPGPDFDPYDYRRAHPELEPHRGCLAHHLAALRAQPAPAAVVAPAPEVLPPEATPMPPEVEAEVAAEDLSHFTGSFDAVDGAVAMGWAFDNRRPMERLVVEIVADGVVVGRGRADVYREDLLEHGIGDGIHAFHIRLAQDLADGGRHEVIARIADAHGAVLNGQHVYAASPGGRAFDTLPVASAEPIAAERARAHGDRADDYRRRIDDAGLQLATGAAEEAEALLRALDADYPGDPLVALRLGEAALHQGRFDAAAAAFGAASGDEATAAWSLLGLGNARRLQGDLEGAEPFFRQAQARSPSLAPVAARLSALTRQLARKRAWVLVSEGDVGGALALLVPELAASPDDAELAAQVASLLVPDADAHGADPVVHQARRSLALLEAVMAHARSKRVRA